MRWWGWWRQSRLTRQVCAAEANIALLSVGEGPVLAKGAMALLVGERITLDLIPAAAEIAGSSDIEPNGDIHASAEYRRHLAKVLTRRVLAEASGRAVVDNGN